MLFYFPFFDTTCLMTGWLSYKTLPSDTMEYAEMIKAIHSHQQMGFK